MKGPLDLTRREARRLGFALVEPEVHAAALSWYAGDAVIRLAHALLEGEEIRIGPENEKSRNHRSRRRALRFTEGEEP